MALNIHPFSMEFHLSSSQIKPHTHTAALLSLNCTPLYSRKAEHTGHIIIGTIYLVGKSSNENCCEYNKWNSIHFHWIRVAAEILEKVMSKSLANQLKHLPLRKYFLSLFYFYLFIYFGNLVQSNTLSLNILFVLLWVAAKPYFVVTVKLNLIWHNLIWIK